MKFIKIGESKNFIVFLHGWGADKNSFFWLTNYFFDHTLLFIDFAGFGESGEPDKPWTVSDYVDDLKSLIDKFKVESLVLVGHSFGGRVAIKFAYLYQNDFRQFKLCLVDSAGVKPRRNLFYYFKIWKYKLVKKIAKRFKKYEKTISKYGSNDYKMLSSIMKRTFINVINEDLLPVAKFIKSPTIIVWGDKDFETKIYMAKKLNKVIDNSKLFIIKGAGHFSFLDNRQEFLIILDTFIKN